MSEETATTVEPSTVSGGSAPKQKRRRNPVLRYDQIYDVQKCQIRLVETEKPDQKQPSGRRAVLCVRRLINDKGFHFKTDVDIKSNYVAKVMQDICFDFEDLSLRTSPPMVPIETFFHTKTALQTKLEEAQACEPPEEERIHDLEVAAHFAKLNLQ